MEKNIKELANDLIKAIYDNIEYDNDGQPIVKIQYISEEIEALKDAELTVRELNFEERLEMSKSQDLY